jgi:para-nitrobenzyl esterase
MDIVKTEAGYVSGTVVGDVGKEVYIFRGIPYAAPPVGDLRWKPPQPAAPWSGIRECTVFSNQAPQYVGPTTPQAPGALKSSEDCLYLNVLTPVEKAGEKLPVMVWLHGGGFSIGHGNSPMSNSPGLPQNGSVLVTVNMRLGAIGLLAHPLLSKESANGVSGNYMFLDMIAALQWVQRNIAAFGGDPSKVTIFGESGGGGKVIGLLASPRAKGLFHRAICESGGMPHSTPLKELEARGEKLFARLGINREADPLAAARAIHFDIILKAADDMNVEMNLPIPQASIDSAIDGWFLTDRVVKVISEGKHNAVPYIQGATLGELTGPGLLINGKELILPQMIPNYVAMFAGVKKANTKGYAFIFNQVPGKWKEEGAVSCHGIELPYVFGALNVKEELAFLRGGVAPSGGKSIDPEPTETDEKVSKAMMRIWVQFAKTGDPSVKGLVKWPTYEAATDQYLYIAEPLEVKSGFSKLVQE